MRWRGVSARSSSGRWRASRTTRAKATANSATVTTSSEAARHERVVRGKGGRPPPSAASCGDFVWVREGWRVTEARTRASFSASRVPCQLHTKRHIRNH